jgi:hypothetical protein
MHARQIPRYYSSDVLAGSSDTVKMKARRVIPAVAGAVQTQQLHGASERFRDCTARAAAGRRSLRALSHGGKRVHNRHLPHAL